MSKQISYIEHFQLDHAPFRQETDPEIFFADGGREKTLQRLLADIGEGKPLIRLTGSEGVGKTLFYQLVAKRLPAGRFEPVCLDHPVGSFEDLLRPICQALGCANEGEAVVRQSFLSAFREQLKDRREKQVRVVLLIDNAEKLFLATLERMIRLICDSDAEGTLQILLIGRPELDKNVDQLAVYCGGVDLNVRHVLQPLTRGETERYVRFRLGQAGAPADKQEKIFTGDAIAALYQGAGGNIRLSNMFAEKGLITACESGLSSVEAESIFPRSSGESDVRGMFARIVERFRRYRLWVFVGTAMALVLLLIPLRPAKETKSSAPVSREQSEPAAEAPQPVTPPEAAVGKNPLPDGGAANGTQEPVAAGEPVHGDGEHAPEEPDAVEKVEKGEEKKQAAAVEDAPAEQVIVPVAPRKEMVVIQPESRKKKDFSPAITAGKKQPAEGRDPQAIFQERLRATSNWLAWSYRGGYTIQLMMLGSESAADNLQALLVRDDYYAVKDELYILRKSSQPTLIVFYGLYDTMAEARRVRDNLPQFMLKNQPYALSIKEALKKAGE